MPAAAQLSGLRLALYDEALSAGPAGLTSAELRARTEADRNRLRAEGQHSDTLDWLVANGWLRQYRPDCYRAVAKEAVLAAPSGAEKREAGRQKLEDGERKTEGNGYRPTYGGTQSLAVQRAALVPETPNPKPETLAAPRAALRAPSACPQQPKKGQLALFGTLR